MEEEDEIKNRLEFISDDEDPDTLNIIDESETSRRARKEAKQFQGKKYDKSTFLKDQRFRFDTLIRILLSVWAAVIVTWWLSFVSNIISYPTTHYLSDAVLIALLGTTTLNVLGLMVIVLKGLLWDKNNNY